MGKYKVPREKPLRNVCFSLQEEQIKTLWKLVEQNGFISLSEMMRDIIRDYINRTINLVESMENYTKGYRREVGIDHIRFRKLCNDELKVASK